MNTHTESDMDDDNHNGNLTKECCFTCRYIRYGFVVNRDTKSYEVRTYCAFDADKVQETDIESICENHKNYDN